jgi:hypothetical protein
LFLLQFLKVALLDTVSGLAVIFFQGLKYIFHALLAFRVSTEKYAVILMGLPLFNIFFNFNNHLFKKWLALPMQKF